MKVIPFPHCDKQKKSHSSSSSSQNPSHKKPHHCSESYTIEDSINHMLMDITENALHSITNDLRQTAHNKIDLRNQLIFVLDKLASIADDLKSATAKSS